MRNLCCFVLLLFCAARGYAQSNPYLFGWVGDDAKKSDVLGDIPKNTAENRTEEELKGLENEVVQAMLGADMPAMDRIFSDDWIIVDEEAQVRDKKSEFEPYKTGEEKLTAGRLDDMRVRLFGEAAVVTGRSMFKGGFQGKPFDIRCRFTDIWVRRNGRWQIVSSQNTAIPEARATEFPPDSFFIAMEKEDWEALKHKDKVAATRLLADDFVGMYDFGFFTKSEWIKQIDEQYTVDDYTIENPKLLRPSANTALLLYTSNCKGTGTWTEFCSHASRISDLFVERNGQWVALFSQDTQATSSQPLPHDDLSRSSRMELPTGKDSVETVASPSADRTVVNLDAHTKFTPFEEMIIGKEKEVLDLSAKGDYANWAHLLSDDAVAVYDTGYASKAEVLKSLKGMSDMHWSMDKVKVMPIGKAAALIIYRMTQDWKEQGKPMASSTTFLRFG